MFWVEPGEYLIEAARSAKDPKARRLSMTISGGEIPHQVFTDAIVDAQRFDDYSHLGKMELIHCEYDGDTAVKLDADGAWLCYRDVDFSGSNKPSLVTLLVSADRDTELSLYACPPWDSKNPLEPHDPETDGKPIKTISIKDTRPDISLSPCLGIGPGMDKDDPAFTNKPNWIKIRAGIDGLSGVCDLYIKTSRRGASLRWFKFAGAADKTVGISLCPEKRLGSIRVKNGVLCVKAVPEPASSMDTVIWSVSDSGGNASAIAKISGTGTLSEWGLLEALGAGNGRVRVTAVSGGKSVSLDVLVTNQLDGNKYALDGEPVTVDYILLKTDITISDHIIRKNGSLRLTPFFRAPEKTYGNLNDDYDTLQTDKIEWSVSDLHDEPTNIASIDGDGLLSALGVRNGPVKVRAVYKGNRDIFAERVIVLENQETRKAYKLTQAECYDERTPYQGPPISPYAVGPVIKSLAWDLDGLLPDMGNAFVPGGNEMGLFCAAEDGNVFVYRDFEFGDGPSAFVIRLAAHGEVSVDILVDGTGGEGKGVLLGTIGPIPQGNSATYRTWSVDIERPVRGRHDLYMVYRGRARINWFQFLPG
jgi:hypothetical protein